MSNDTIDINELLEKLVSYQNLSEYHTRLISALGLIANSGEFEYDDNVEVPVYDSDSKKWTNISIKIAEAVSQLYKLINDRQAGADEFDENDFKFNVISYDPSKPDEHQKQQ